MVGSHVFNLWAPGNSLGVHGAFSVVTWHMNGHLALLLVGTWHLGGHLANS